MCEYLDCSFLFFCLLFWKYEFNIFPFFLFPFFLSKIWNSHAQILERGKPVHKSCISMDDFFVQNSQTTSQQSIRIGFRKNSPGKRTPINSPVKKKNMPSKAKNIAPSLAHKKEEDDKTISQIERIVQDWLQMDYKG